VKPTVVAVIARVDSTVAALSAVWLDEAPRDATLPYAVVSVSPGGPDRAAFGGRATDERMLFAIRVYGTDAPTVAGYLDSLAAAFDARASKLSLSAGQHLGTWGLGASMPHAGKTAAGLPCYYGELRLRIESTRA